MTLATLGVGQAAADSVSVSASPNPVLNVSGADTTITVSGSTTHDSYYLFLHGTYKPAGSGSCAATYNTDTGQIWVSQNLSQAADGSFSAPADLPTGQLGIGPGTYEICVWVEHSNHSQLVGSTQLTVRPPHSSLTLSPPIADPNGLGFHLTVSYGLEAGPGRVIVYTYDDASGTRPCPADDSNIGVALGFFDRLLGNGGPVSGSAVGSANAGGLPFKPGLWRICAYLSSSGNGVIGAVTATVIVPKHGPTSAGRCKVPSLRGKPLARAKRALTAAHCTVGRITREKRGGKRRGTVLSQSARPGKTLPIGSMVGLVVAK